MKSLAVTSPFVPAAIFLSKSQPGRRLGFEPSRPGKMRTSVLRSQPMRLAASSGLNPSRFIQQARVVMDRALCRIGTIVNSLNMPIWLWNPLMVTIRHRP